MFLVMEKCARRGKPALGFLLIFVRDGEVKASRHRVNAIASGADDIYRAVQMRGDSIALGIMRSALVKKHDSDFETGTDRAQSLAKRRRRFALSVPFKKLNEP